MVDRHEAAEQGNWDLAKAPEYRPNNFLALRF
jgi:hypothetical protein